MKPFSFRTDLKRVKWAPTIKLNFLRAFAFNSVGAAIMLLLLIKEPSWAGLGMAVVQPLVGSIGFLLFATMLLLFIKIVAEVAPGSWGDLAAKIIMPLFSIPVAIIADPILYQLQKRHPALVPVEEFKPMNFAFILFVL